MKGAAVCIAANVLAFAAHIYLQSVYEYTEASTSEIVAALTAALWLVIPTSAAWALHQTMRYERRLLAITAVSFFCWTMTFAWSYFVVMMSWNPDSDSRIQYAASLICETYCPGDTWEQFVRKQRSLQRMFEPGKPQAEPRKLGGTI